MRAIERVGVWGLESCECYKQNPVDNSGGSFEDENGQQRIAQETSEEIQDSIVNWCGGCSCDILASNLAVNCLCPTNLNNTEHRSDGFICLVEEVR